MDVLFFSSGLAFHFGGPAFSESALISSLQKTENVQVLTLTGRAEKKLIEEYSINNVREFRKVDSIYALLFPSHWLSKEIRSARVIHFNGHWKWWYFFLSLCAVRYRIPYILHPRGMLLVGHRKKWIKKLFNFFIGNYVVNHAAKVIALSKYEVEQFSPYSLSPERIEVVPNGIPVEEGKKTVVPILPKGVISYFLYIGRIESRKNLVFLIHGFNEYVKKGGSSDLLIVGPTERGYDQEISREVEKYHLEDKVFILPPTYHDQKAALLSNAVAVVYPSFDEPYGRVPFEAIGALSYPVIPIESGSSEYIRRFLPDCIFENDNRDSLANTLFHVESMKNKSVDRRLIDAREWVKTELNWKNISQQVLRIYQTAQN